MNPQTGTQTTGPVPRRTVAALALGIVPTFALTACIAANSAHGVPVVSQCDGTVNVVIHDTGPPLDEPWVVEVTPEGTDLGVGMTTDRVWFESADGVVLNEVTLTAEEVTINNFEFDELVIEADHCGQLEQAPSDG